MIYHHKDWGFTDHGCGGKQYSIRRDITSTYAQMPKTKLPSGYTNQPLFIKFHCNTVWCMIHDPKIEDGYLDLSHLKPWQITNEMEIGYETKRYKISKEEFSTWFCNCTARVKKGGVYGTDLCYSCYKKDLAFFKEWNKSCKDGCNK